MMLEVDWASIRRVREHPRPLLVTTCVNWGVQPFIMFGLAVLFFRVVFASTIDDTALAKQYVAGAAILGGSPCTAMVFVWSHLAAGDPSYTLVQVLVNDILIFVLYVPTLVLLLNATDIEVPYDTVVLSVALFVLVPFLFGSLARSQVLRRRGAAGVEALLRRLKPFTVFALLATLVLIFVFQGERITDNPLHILLIAVPETLQTYIVFAIAYSACWLLRIEHRFAAPASFIAASNFFELGVAVAISAYGLDSGATLANVVGVLTEVPVMLSLVAIANRTRHWFAFHDAHLELRELDAKPPLPRTRDSMAAADAGGGAAARPAEPDASRLPALRCIVETLRANRDVLFVCTANSRRSVFAQVWLHAALLARGLGGPRVLSAGSEPTGVDARTLAALQRAGAVVSGGSRGRATVALPGCEAVALEPRRVGEATESLEPGFTAVMVCSDADARCPVVQGAAQRVALPYPDPKHADDTAAEAQTYDAICKQIRGEMEWVVFEAASGEA
jgi:ACR3 family arsenite transporter